MTTQTVPVPAIVKQISAFLSERLEAKSQFHSRQVKVYADLVVRESTSKTTF
jgi:hypothetical protein